MPSLGYDVGVYGTEEYLSVTYGDGTYGAGTYGGVGAGVSYDPPGSSGPVRFRYKVAISITTADGRTLRYGPDEPRADGVPFATTYSSTIPGGHDQATFSLRTRITDELPFSLLDDVRIYGPGNVTLWEGYVAQLPRQSGDDFLVNVQCVGHSGRLKWDTGFREIYVDRDLSRWGEWSHQRITNLHAAQYYRGNWSREGQPDSTAPGISHVNSRLATTAGTGPFAVIETWYDGSGVPLGSLYYDQTQSSLGANWQVFAHLTTTDVLPSSDVTANLNGGASTGTLSATTADRGYAVLQTVYVGTFTGDGTWSNTWRRLAVFGNHGLTKQGTAPDQGYYPHDVLEDVVSRAGSGLTTSGVEANTSFILTQLAFPAPITAEDAILELNKYYLWEWGCWGREFFWRQPDPDRLTWEARMDQGAHLNLEGDEAGNAINGVMVSYSLPDGTNRTAGPVGSGAWAEDAALGDTSSSNPVNAHGITAKYAKLDVSFPTTDSGAIAIGAAYLAQLSLPARKGAISLTGYVQHPTKGLRPVSEVRAGDWVRVSDSSSPQVARRIVQVSHDADNRACQLDVGNDVDKVDAILQRVGIKSSLIG